MTTKEIIKFLKKEHIVGDAYDIKDEIIQRLQEYDELKRIIYDAIDPVQEIFEYLISVFQEDEDTEGSLDSMEEK